MKYFDFELILDAEFDREIFPLEVLGETFLVRKMTGTEYADFQAEHQRRGLSASVLTSILAKNVYYNETRPLPIKTVKAEHLLEHRFDLATALVVEIANMSREYFEGLSRAKEQALKN